MTFMPIKFAELMMSSTDGEKQRKRRQMCKEGKRMQKREEELTRRETERGRRSSRGGVFVEAKMMVKGRYWQQEENDEESCIR